MSLITRCPACSTLFKVVPDQLRISAGWVRCGHCSEVFDASVSILSYEESVAVVPKVVPSHAATAASSGSAVLPASAGEAVPSSAGAPEGLSSGLARTSVPEPSPPAVVAAKTSPAPAMAPISGAREAPPPSRVPAQTASMPPRAPEEIQVDPPPGFERPPGVRYGDAAAAASPIDLLRVRRRGTSAADASLPIEAPDDRADSRPAHSPAAERDSAFRATQPAAAPPTTRIEPLGPDSLPAPDPSFVRQARRRAFWRSGPMRGALWMLLLALATALAGQMAYTHRDWVAAREPRLAPLLSAACARLGCTIEPYRNLDAITIESSNFNRVSPGAFQLSLTLRNASDLAVATPALELTLTNAQDQAIMRRVLRPTDFAAAPALPARGDWSGASALTVTSVPDQASIVGYRLLAFYP